MGENDNETVLGTKAITGRLVSLDDESIDNLDQMSKSLKQMEQNLKENIASNMK